jgi:hypothetical protein
MPVVTAVDGRPGREGRPASSVSRLSPSSPRCSTSRTPTRARSRRSAPVPAGTRASCAPPPAERWSVELDPGRPAGCANTPVWIRGSSPATVFWATRTAPPRATVVATCSVDSVLPAWIERTRPGGVLPAPWTSPWVSYGIARLVRDEHGGASDPFAALGSVMSLRPAAVGHDPDPPAADHDAPARERVSASEATRRCRGPVAADTPTPVSPGVRAVSRAGRSALPCPPARCRSGSPGRVVTPGRTHDPTAARAHGIVRACPTRRILVLADRACPGAGPPFAPPVTITANGPSTTRSSTVITPGRGLPENVPSHRRKPGDRSGGPDAPSAASAPSSRPSARS